MLAMTQPTPPPAAEKISDRELGDLYRDLAEEVSGRRSRLPPDPEMTEQ